MTTSIKWTGSRVERYAAAIETSGSRFADSQKVLPYRNLLKVPGEGNSTSLLTISTAWKNSNCI
ncbi:hypothetical protein LTS18_006017 [Coniosporium uncinatum]|uniref:Uncharacterized protein n=1 Tax=Coniosporium uncinatum TaxID=93489 RepID=A0ACC3DBE6_9PEZI|nr:hypothetical protein LTS18_006017 [Coniosporium uncinatum]